MSPTRLLLPVLALIFVGPIVIQAAPAPTPVEPIILPVWREGKMPGVGADLPELNTGTGKGQYWRITNVSMPTIAVYKAPGVTSATPAMVICPGGGYGILSYSLEGTEIAAWLNSVGITGIVLKYRVPKNRDGALQDIVRAMRLVRSHAAEWNIDQKRLGVIGFSAGGHLAVRLSTNWKQDAYPPIDSVDTLSCRPDFVVLNYAAYLGSRGKMAEGLPISADIPPTLIMHAEDDVNYVDSSKTYHAALDEAHLPNEFILFPTGGHGYCLHTDKDAKVWPQKCLEWLKQIGVL